MVMWYLHVWSGGSFFLMKILQKATQSLTKLFFPYTQVSGRNGWMTENDQCSHIMWFIMKSSEKSCSKQRRNFNLLKIIQDHIVLCNILNSKPRDDNFADDSEFSDFCGYGFHRTGLRPNLIDVLFLRSFPDTFQRDERNKNKNKRKNRQKGTWKCSWLFLKVNVQKDPRNKWTEFGLKFILC